MSRQEKPSQTQSDRQPIRWTPRARLLGVVATFAGGALIGGYTVATIVGATETVPTEYVECADAKVPDDGSYRDAIEQIVGTVGLRDVDSYATSKALVDEYGTAHPNQAIHILYQGSEAVMVGGGACPTPAG